MDNKINQRAKEIMPVELLDVLKDLIASGDVVVDLDDQQYFVAIGENYPHYRSAIKWSEVPTHIGATIPKDNNIESMHTFLALIAKKASLTGQEKVIIIGDSILNCALITRFEVLISIIQDLNDLPEHNYIIPPDVSWCFAMRIGGEFEFGFRPPQGGQPVRFTRNGHDYY